MAIRIEAIREGAFTVRHKKDHSAVWTTLMPVSVTVIAVAFLFACNKDSGEPKVIRARQIVLVDESGTERIRLAATGSYSGIFLMDGEGQPAISVGVDERKQSPTIQIFGDQGFNLMLASNFAGIVDESNAKSVQMDVLGGAPRVFLGTEESSWFASSAQSGFAENGQGAYFTQPDGFYLNSQDGKTLAHLTRFDSGLVKFALQSQAGSRIQMSASNLGGAVDTRDVGSLSMAMFEGQTQRMTLEPDGFAFWDGESTAELQPQFLRFSDKKNADDAMGAYIGFGTTGEAMMALRVEQPGTDKYYTAP